VAPGYTEGEGGEGDIVVDVERARVLLINMDLQGRVLLVLSSRKEGKARGMGRGERGREGK